MSKDKKTPPSQDTKSESKSEEQKSVKPKRKRELRNKIIRYLNSALKSFVVLAQSVVSIKIWLQINHGIPRVV